MKRSKILEYSNFRKNYNFTYKELKTIDVSIYFDDELVEDAEKKYAEGEKFLNIGYNFKNSNSRILSNLYPLKFKFRGKMVSSIEGVLQGCKYKDKKIQNLILKYAGLDAYHTRAANTLDFWGNNGTLYWQGKPMKRYSEKYQLFLDELYLSALTNPIYRRGLLATGEKYLLHHIGGTDTSQTVLTRYEYELRLNSLRDWIKRTELK